MKSARHDVLVVGGGPAGVGAALAAARGGSQVALVERSAWLGGAGVDGLVSIWMPSCAARSDREIILGIFREIRERLERKGKVAFGAAYDPTAFHEEVMGLLHAAGVAILLETGLDSATTEGERVVSVSLLGKDGHRREVTAGQYVDASGDACLVRAVGGHVRYGRTSDGKVQPSTLIFSVAPVDTYRFSAYLGGRAHLLDARGCLLLSGLVPEVRRAKAAGHISSINRHDLALMWSNPSNPTEVLVNFTRIQGVNGADPHAAELAMREGERQVHEAIEFFRRFLPGFEGAALKRKASSLGVRETYRIEGLLELNEDDLVSGRKWPDGIACGAYPVDIHDPVGGHTRFEPLKSGLWYEIPYRALVPANLANVIVAGRCISGTHEAMSSYRVQPICTAMGEAAGIACLVAQAIGITDFRDLDGGKVRQRLDLPEDGKTPVSDTHLWVVPHSHWDREWYLSFEEFRVHLVELLDRVLARLERSPEFLFHLDGQAVILEDYLALRPEAEPKLAEHLQSGRLKAGPSYSLIDHQQVSAELITRNLLLGRSVGTRFGARRHLLLYAPDSFGHCAQLPQLLSSFGIRTFIFSRGLGNTPAKPYLHLYWTGPDGSTIRAAALVMDLFTEKGDWIAGAYANGRLLPDAPEALAQRMRELVEAQTCLGDSRHVLVLNGCDHAPPDEQLERKIRIMSGLPGIESAQCATLEMWEERVMQEARLADNREDVSGRLNDSRYLRVLPHVGSAGIRAKQAYGRAVRNFESTYDPWLAYAFLHGDRFGVPFLINSWKLLVQNASHDSICLCSCDRVYREFTDRTERAHLEGARVARRALKRIHQDDPRRLEPLDARDEAALLWNPLPRERTCIVKASFFTENGAAHWAACADRATTIPCTVISTQPTAKLQAAFGPAEIMGQSRREVSVLLGPVRLPACGWSTVRFIPIEQEIPVEADPPAIPAVWLAERTPDHGDTYEARLIREQTQRVTLSFTDGDDAKQGATLADSSFVLRHGNTRDLDRKAAVVPVRLALSSEEERVRLRLGVGFPEPIAAAWGLTPAYWQPLATEFPDDTGWVAPKAPEDILLGAVCLQTASGAWALVMPDLLEWEWDRRAKDTVWVTLRRSVDRLGSPGTGPELRVHAVKEPGSTVVEGALIFSPAGDMEAVQKAVESALCPPSAHPFGDGMAPLDGQSLLAIEGAWLSLSTIKTAEDGRGIVVRLWNRAPAARTGRLDFRFPVGAVWRAGLDERKFSQLEVSDDGISLSLGPCQIETLLIYPPAATGTDSA